MFINSKKYNVVTEIKDYSLQLVHAKVGVVFFCLALA